MFLDYFGQCLNDVCMPFDGTASTYGYQDQSIWGNIQLFSDFFFFSFFGWKKTVTTIPIINKSC